MLKVLTPELTRLHVDRIAVPCIADLFAISEVTLPSTLAAEIKNWATRAARDILDLPDGTERIEFLNSVLELPPGQIPASMREPVLGLGTSKQTDVTRLVDDLRSRFEQVPPDILKLPAPARKETSKSGADAGAAGTSKTTRTTAEKAPKVAKVAKTPRAPRTPASMVDPRRAEFIRGDVMDRLSVREYAERGLKESIVIAGVRHRSPFKDMTEEEVKAEMRKLEREGKVKHTGDRWIIR